MAIVSSHSAELPEREAKPAKTRAKAKAVPAGADPQVLAPQIQGDEEGKPEDSLRPKCLADYVGQRDLKEVLEIAIQAAKVRQERLDHLLFYGPPGLGKTTLALVLAQEMGVNCKVTSAPALERPRDIVGLLMGLQSGDLLFIDEIHRLSKVTEEILYPAMEDCRLDITLGKGQSARTRSVLLKPFTLIGATTQMGAMTSPLRDRFGLVQRLRFYEPEELQAIVLRSAQVLNTPLDPSGAMEIAQRSRGTPRIANRLLKRVRDYATVKYGSVQDSSSSDQNSAGQLTGQASPASQPPVNQAFIIDQTIAAEALERYQVDPCGLDWVDRRLLSTLIEHYQGGPAGLETLAAATGEDAQTIESVYEPYLLQRGYLQRTPRGRLATPLAWQHLGYSPQSKT